MVEKLLTEGILKFNTIEEFQDIKEKYNKVQKIKFNCQKCGQEVIRTVDRISGLVKWKEFNFLCRNCQFKKTNLEKYGVENINNLESFKKKIKETRIKNNSFNSEKRLEGLRKAFKERNKEIQEKRKQTNIEKYGQPYATHLEKCPYCNWEMDYQQLQRHIKCCEKNPKNIIDEKDGVIQLTENNLKRVKQLPKSLQRHKSISYTCLKCGQKIVLKSFLEFKNFNTCPSCSRIETNLKKYGTRTPSENKNIKEKVRRSHLNHTQEQIEESNQKRKQTCLKKYGVEAVAQNKEIQKKQIESNLERYGVKNYSQTKEARRNRRSQYVFDNQYFDSRPELSFYIWAKDNKLNIKRNCQKDFEYIWNSEKHYYFPDFEIDGKYYEIKGGQFLTKDGKWRDPFNPQLNEKAELKHQCALKNNVTILYEKDYQKYTNYIKKKYGQSYLQQFKIKKDVNLEKANLN